MAGGLTFAQSRQGMLKPTRCVSAEDYYRAPWVWQGPQTRIAWMPVASAGPGVDAGCSALAF